MSSENIKKGGISVETQNIFPVIKKWLYSDKDIFVRELVSNANDAITKHKRLVSLGETQSDGEDYKIEVCLDTELGTLTFCDNGLGMSEDEVDKYINQIALSGALDFIEKYEGKSGDAGKGIIGHFGLGFYSAFMIADKVEIRTKSYRDDEKAVLWTGLDDGSFEMRECDKQNRGTEITLFINDDEKDYATEYKIKEILDKFCAFMPTPIFYTVLPEKENKDGEQGEIKPINDVTPLWLKKPSECTDEEYKAFYRKVFLDFNDPLFWVHISADYPLNFKGILYFPKLSNEYNSYEGQIKLFYNQVFVADNIKEVIPEFMFMFKGVLDCPELPLNVSRSYLQANGYVSKISAHITKKVTDKIVSMFSQDREGYEKIFDDVKPFMEYASIKDNKFYSKVQGTFLYKTTDSKYLTLCEYSENENFDGNIYYTDDKVRQSKYVSMFASQSVPVVQFDMPLDVQFVSFAETQMPEDNEKLKSAKFVRVDSGVSDILKDKDGERCEEKENKLTEFFKETLEMGENFKITTERLKDDTVPAVLNLTEQSRRFADMMKAYGQNVPGMPTEETLVLNLSNSLVKKTLLKIDEDKDFAKKLAKHIYMLSLLSQRQLSEDELSSFIACSSELLSRL